MIYFRNQIYMATIVDAIDVSRLCSEWEEVGPPRLNHRSNINVNVKVHAGNKCCFALYFK